MNAQIAACFKDSNCEGRGFKRIAGFEDHCYMVESEAAKTWDDAQMACQLRKSNLFTPASQEEEDALARSISTTVTTEDEKRRYHIGLRNTGKYCSSNEVHMDLCLQ